MFKNEGTEHFKIHILNCNNILNITDLTVSHSVYSTVAHSRKVVSHKMINQFWGLWCLDELFITVSVSPLSIYKV